MKWGEQFVGIIFGIYLSPKHNFRSKANKDTNVWQGICSYFQSMIGLLIISPAQLLLQTCSNFVRTRKHKCSTLDSILYHIHAKYIQTPSVIYSSTRMLFLICETLQRHLEQSRISLAYSKQTGIK